jgi:hypothetical protein
VRIDRQLRDGSALSRCRTGGTLAAATLLALVWCGGCGYPRVGPQTYQIAKALHTVFNLRDEAGLPRAREYLAQAASRGEISERDHGLLERLVDMAEAGDWHRAEREVLRLLADQNER